MIQDLRDRYKYDFFNPEILAQTEELFFYNMNINFFVKPEGLNYLMNTKEEKIRKNWENYVRYGNTENKIDRLIRLIISYKRHKEKNNKERMAELGLSIMKTLENNLSVKGFLSMFGGGRYALAIGKIEGYRVGDEKGDEGLISNSIGREGTEGLLGPLGTMQGELGMSNGEFFLSWILGRVI